MKYDNLINGERVAVTHGELVLIPIDTIPKGEVKSSNKEILAHSETGHHHILEAEQEFELITSGEDRAVLIKEVAKLWHNKTFDIHETRIIAPGAYIVKEKTEYNPLTKVIQRVFD